MQTNGPMPAVMAEMLGMGRFRMKSIMAGIIRDLAVQTEGSEVLIEFPGRVLSRRVKIHVPR